MQYQFSFFSSATLAAIPASFAAEFFDRLLYCARTYFIRSKIYFALSFFPTPNPAAALLLPLLLGPSRFTEDEVLTGAFSFDFEPPVNLSIANRCLSLSAGEYSRFFISALVDFTEAESVCRR